MPTEHSLTPQQQRRSHQFSSPASGGPPAECGGRGSVRAGDPVGGAVAEHAAVERLPVGRHHPLVRLRGRAPAGGGGGGRRRRRGGRGVTGRARGALIVDDVGREPHPLLRLAAAAALRPAPSPSLLCKLKKKKKRRVRNLAPNPPHERAVAASPSIVGLVSYRT